MQNPISNVSLLTHAITLPNSLSSKKELLLNMTINSFRPISRVYPPDDNQLQSTFELEFVTNEAVLFVYHPPTFNLQVALCFSHCFRILTNRLAIFIASHFFLWECCPIWKYPVPLPLLSTGGRAVHLDCILMSFIFYVQFGFILNLLPRWNKKKIKRKDYKIIFRQLFANHTFVTSIPLSTNTNWFYFLDSYWSFAFVTHLKRQNTFSILGNFWIDIAFNVAVCLLAALL